MKWVRLGLLFFCIAFVFAFALIPWFQVYFSEANLSSWASQVMRELRFESTVYWKAFLTYYLALWCGKAILWALSTAPSKPS